MYLALKSRGLLTCKHEFVVYRWKIQKLTYEERQAALVKRLNAINGEDEE